jgi:hypothetical protein
MIVSSFVPCDLALEQWVVPMVAIEKRKLTRISAIIAWRSREPPAHR